MLTIDQIHKTFAAVPVLDDVNLKVKAGEFVAIQGPSGCGKSTLLLTCGGLLFPNKGKVLINNTDLYAQSPDQRADFRGEHIGFVFQQFHLIPYLNLRDNILYASLAAKTEAAQTRTDDLMEQFNLQDRATHKPAALSIGQRQRTALARALLNNPKLILADEPTGNLDPDNSKTVLTALADYTRTGGAVLLVTHDPSITHYADRILSMDKGRLKD